MAVQKSGTASLGSYLDLELRYGKNSRNAGSKISPSSFELTMIAFWKPPGALQWVEKCVTETIYKEKNPRYSMKMQLHCDVHDAPGIELKFQLFEGNYFGPQKVVFMNTLGLVQTTLSRLLAVGSVGLLVPIEFPEDDKDPFSVRSHKHRVFNAQCFLRAEILKPIDDAIVLQFGILQKQSQTRQFFSRKNTSYYLELLKINEGVNFEINQPYTLIHRSEQLQGTNHCWGHIILPIARICNGDMDRVLKIVIYDSNHTFLTVDGERIKTGFVLTTLRKLLDIGSNNTDPKVKRCPIVKSRDGKDSQKICLLVNQCSVLELVPMETYLNSGLAIRRIYAVDYSKSNWNYSLHKCNLYENSDGPSTAIGAAPYEQAIEISAKIIQPLASGQSVFYSFGNPHMKQFVETIDERNHLRNLFHLYGEALIEAKQQADNAAMLAEDFASDQCFKKLAVNQGKRSTLLVPILNDLLALLSMRETSTTQMEYFVAFIFTDGEFIDLEESMKLIIELAKHPISIIFMALGLGNLEFLLSLQEGWVHPTTNEYPKRNIITVIHFRSLQNWYSSIKYGSQFKTDPLILLQKEIFTALDKQTVQFLRIVSTS